MPRAANDDHGVSQSEGTRAVDHGRALLDLYDVALPAVYGYLKPRSGDPMLAEDLAAETFLAACDAVQRGQVRTVTVAWLIGIARHKLVDHWRREERRERHLRAVEDATDAVDDPWDAAIDAAAVEEVLGSLSAVHRTALTLRYLDGLAVTEVAALLDRTVAATDQVLARARRAFRNAYGERR